MNKIQTIATLIGSLSREEIDKIAKAIAPRLDNSYPDEQSWKHEWLAANLLYDIRDLFPAEPKDY